MDSGTEASLLEQYPRNNGASSSLWLLRKYRRHMWGGHAPSLSRPIDYGSAFLLPDIDKDRAQADREWSAQRYAMITHDTYSTNSLLFSDANLTNCAPSEDVVASGKEFLWVLAQSSFKQRYLRVLQASCPKPTIGRTHTLQPSPFPHPNCLPKIRVPRPVRVQGLLIDLLRVLAYEPPDTITIASMESSISWTIQTLPRSIWLIDDQALRFSGRILKSAREKHGQLSPLASFLYSYFAESDLPLSITSFASSTISPGHLSLGVRLYLQVYKYHLIRRAVSFASAHSLNGELQAAAIKINKRELWQKFLAEATQIQSVHAHNAALQSLLKSIPNTASRVSLSCQRLKMTLNGIKSKLIQHEKQHNQSLAYWNGKNMELEQERARHLKLLTEYNNEVLALEAKRRRLQEKQKQVTDESRKIRPILDRLRNRLSGKEIELSRLSSQREATSRKLATEEQRIKSIKSLKGQVAKSNLQSMRNEFDRVDILLSSMFIANKSFEYSNIITDIQAYITRLTGIKDIGPLFTNLHSLKEKMRVIHASGFSQLIIDGLDALRSINCRTPARFTKLFSSTGLTLTQRTDLIGELNVFLQQKYPQFLAYYKEQKGQQKEQQSSACFKLSSEISVVINSPGNQERLRFQSQSGEAPAEEVPVESPESFAEMTCLFESPLVWGLLHYKYIYSKSQEQNVIQYVKESCVRTSFPFMYRTLWSA